MSPLLNKLVLKLVLAVALLVMPLQGIAATLSVLLCHGEVRAHAMHADDAGDRTMVSDTQLDNGGIDGSLASHPCCHNIVSAVPIATPLAALSHFPVRTFTPHSLHDLFVPDRPQRPPLA